MQRPSDASDRGGRIRGRLAATLIVAALATACQLQPPISLSARESLAGQGLVVIVTNTSDEFLHDVTVTIKSPDNEVKKHFEATLEPHDSINVGWLKLEAWPIPEGSTVTVSCKGFLRPIGPWKIEV